MSVNIEHIMKKNDLHELIYQKSKGKPSDVSIFDLDKKSNYLKVLKNSAKNWEICLHDNIFYDIFLNIHHDYYNFYNFYMIFRARRIDCLDLDYDFGHPFYQTNYHHFVNGFRFEYNEPENYKLIKVEIVACYDNAQIFEFGALSDHINITVIKDITFLFDKDIQNFLSYLLLPVISQVIIDYL